MQSVRYSYQFTGIYFERKLFGKNQIQTLNSTWFGCSKFPYLIQTNGFHDSAHLIFVFYLKPNVPRFFVIYMRWRRWRWLQCGGNGNRRGFLLLLCDIGVACVWVCRVCASAYGSVRVTVCFGAQIYVPIRIHVCALIVDAWQFIKKNYTTRNKWENIHAVVCIRQNNTIAIVRDTWNIIKIIVSLLLTTSSLLLEWCRCVGDEYTRMIVANTILWTLFPIVAQTKICECVFASTVRIYLSISIAFFSIPFLFSHVWYAYLVTNETPRKSFRINCTLWLASQLYTRNSH